MHLASSFAIHADTTSPTPYPESSQSLHTTTIAWFSHYPSSGLRGDSRGFDNRYRKYRRSLWPDTYARVQRQRILAIVCIAIDMYSYLTHDCPCSDTYLDFHLHTFMSLRYGTNLCSLHIAYVISLCDIVSYTNPTDSDNIKNCVVAVLVAYRDEVMHFENRIIVLSGCSR